MKAPNHIVGGLVITGFFSSLWNVNIFQNLDTVIFTVIASQLPDIDHTKSIIGKCFKPLSKWIDRKFGHRTITHSFLFLILIVLISYSFEKLFDLDHTYSLILFFAVFSHFILDMVTIQGIPLFYPFYRNPCVIPGNVSLRISTNDSKAEIIAFALFVAVGFTSMDLYTNGFWTSYNRTFGTLKHLLSENKTSENLLFCEYDYLLNGVENVGLGCVIATNEYECVLFDKKIINLNKDNESLIIEYVRPVLTTFPKRFEEFGFFNISYDSLKCILNKKIVSGQIQSSNKIQYIVDNITVTSKLLKLNNSYNFELFLLPDSNYNSVEQKINITKIKVEQEKIKYKLKIEEVEKIRTKRNNCKLQFNNDLSDYKKNKIKNELIYLNDLIDRKTLAIGSFNPDLLLEYEIKLLEQQKKFNQTLFSGLISFPILPDSIFNTIQLATN